MAVTAGRRRTIPGGSPRQPVGLIVITGVVFLVYSVVSILNSSYVGYKDANRAAVYPLLVALVVSLALYNVRIPNVPSVSPVSRWLWAIAIWISLIDIWSMGDLWVSVVHAGIAVWWALTYAFFARLGHWSPQARVVVPRLMAVAFVAYVVSVPYAAARIATAYTIDIAVVNIVYYVPAVAPFALMLPRAWLRTLCIVAWVCVVAVSMKRGALVVTALMLMAYVIAQARASRRSPKWLWAGGAISLLVGVAVVAANYATDGYLSSRFEREQLVSGSGRTEIYAVLLDSLGNASPFSLLAGSGSGTTEALVGTGAHNEWLEFLTNFGLVGVLLYVGLLLAMALQVLRLVARGDASAGPVAAAVTYIVITGLYGGVYFVHATFFPLALLGIAHGAEIAATEQPIARRRRHSRITYG